MKKFLLGILVGAAIFVPSSVIAARSIEAEPPMANAFMNIPYEENSVSVFDDQDNKCYIVRGGYRNGTEARTVDISCVKSGE